MGNKGHSEPNIWGGYTHYDSKGHKTGSSEPGFFGGYNHYDSKGNKVGHSDPGIFGGYGHYDTKGNKTGHSDPGLLGGYNHYDSKGSRKGSSNPGVFGGYSNDDSEGCYIATCVYGSYDTPEVWTLRRFRDEYLGSFIMGRAFIHLYYAVSPIVVKMFGARNWFQVFWRNILDRFVVILQNKGYEKTPYADRNWRITHK